MTALITGAAGFIGRALMRAWPSAETIIGVDNRGLDDVNPWPGNCDYRRLDIADEAALEKLALEVKPRRIIHLAAISDTTSGADAIGTNVALTLSALRATLAVTRETNVRCRLVVAGSAAEYGNLEPYVDPPDERASLRATDFYGRSKIASSLLTFGFSVWHPDMERATVLRFGNVYGPGQTRKFIPLVIDRLSHVGDPAFRPFMLAAHGRPTRQWIYIDDAVRAILTSSSYPGGGIFNIAHREELANGYIAARIAVALGLRLGDGTELFLSEEAGGGSMRVAMDVSKVERVLGWKATTDIETGLRATVAAALAQRGQS